MHLFEQLRNYYHAGKLDLDFEKKLGQLFYSPESMHQEEFVYQDETSIEAINTSFFDCLNFVNSYNNSHLVDLGAGQGRLGVAIAALGKNIHYIGLELVQQRFQFAQSLTIDFDHIQFNRESFLQNSELDKYENFFCYLPMELCRDFYWERFAKKLLSRFYVIEAHGDSIDFFAHKKNVRIKGTVGLQQARHHHLLEQFELSQFANIKALNQFYFQDMESIECLIHSGKLADHLVQIDGHIYAFRNIQTCYFQNYWLWIAEHNRYFTKKSSVNLIEINETNSKLANLLVHGMALRSTLDYSLIELKANVWKPLNSIGDIK